MPFSNPAYCWAGAGFTMTPADTARFGAAMLDGPGSRISAAERSLLFTPMTEKTPQSPPLGLGWRIDTDGNGRLRWHHAGATPGGRYSLVVYPELDLAIAMAGNVMAMPLDVGKASSDLADIFA
jgi:CubicO group peptidase (beta-lactamase class C family)